MSFTFFFWAIGAASLGVHLLTKVSDEPGDFADFFADKRNVIYLLTATALVFVGMATYAATTGTDDLGAIMFASAIGMAGGSLSRSTVPSKATKERKAAENTEP